MSTTVSWPSVDDVFAMNRVRIGTVQTVRGSKDTWWYMGEGKITRIADDVPKVQYIPPYCIPYLRRLIAGIPS